MFRASTYRPLVSIGLLFFFMFPMGIKEAHLLWGHHRHAPVCDAKAGEKHLHGPEFQHHECTLCLIHYAQFLGGERTEAPVALLPGWEAAPLASVFSYSHPALSHLRQRGPPSSANLFRTHFG